LTVQFREFESADLDVILDIAVAAWQPVFESTRDIVGDEIFDIAYPTPDDSKRAQITMASQSDDPREIWIAELDNEIVGFIVVHMYHDRRVAEIGNNAVKPGLQHRGIGATMYEFVLDRMRQAGMKAAVVTTGGDEAHAPARRAYEKVGFSGAVPSVEYHIKL